MPQWNWIYNCQEMSNMISLRYSDLHHSLCLSHICKDSRKIPWTARHRLGFPSSVTSFTHLQISLPLVTKSEVPRWYLYKKFQGCLVDYQRSIRGYPRILPGYLWTDWGTYPSWPGQGLEDVLQITGRYTPNTPGYFSVRGRVSL